jgi:hypothetical protein
MGHMLSTVNPEAAEAIKPAVNPFPIRPPVSMLSLDFLVVIK